ncbi:MobA/MobL family protein [Sphingomonas sp. UYP23]
MAVYHFHARIIRRSVGQSVVATAAWQNACRLRDERLGRFSDFTDKRTVKRSEILLPEGAPPHLGDREALWNVLEASEIRKDTQLARQYDLSIPDEFDLTNAGDVLRRFAIANITTAGFPVDMTLIEVAGDGPSPHRHGYLRTPVIKGAIHRAVAPD